jgi:FtsP/CotA-like multicopper oxidase with cupredoxin domain
MVLEHIASGMYGMMIVEPRNGYPTKVDREYAITQSEFYTKPDSQKRKVDGQLLHVLDGDRLRAKAPTYTVFNGRHNGMVDNPLQAKPGERVRLFVMNVGPSNTSSFHVVGTIFDRVWQRFFKSGLTDSVPLMAAERHEVEGLVRDLSWTRRSSAARSRNRCSPGGRAGCSGTRLGRTQNAESD